MASDDICSPGDQEHSLWRATTDSSTDRPQFSPQNPNFDNPNPKIDRKHYLLIFYNIDIIFFTLILGITYTFNYLIEFKPNFYNIKNSQQRRD